MPARLTPELVRKYLDAGMWDTTSLNDYAFRNAQRTPDEVAFRDETGEIDWSEFRRRSSRLAAWLAERGVGRGDVVVVHLPNSIEFALALVAVAHVQAVFCPLQRRLSRRELLSAIEVSGAVAAIMLADGEGDTAAILEAPAAANLRSVLLAGPAPVGSEPRVTALASVLEREADAELVERLDLVERDPAAISRLMFTSGSTGRPKGVLHTDGTTLFANRAFAAAFGIDAAARQLLFMPAALNWGLFQVIQTLVTGSYLRFVDRFRAERVLATVEAERITHIGGPPTALVAILEAVGDVPRDLSSLASYSSAGAPASLALLGQARELLGCPVREGYGMTEVGWISFSDPYRERRDLAGAVGRPYQWMDLKLIDADGRPAEEGEIVVDGPTVCVGYLGDPEFLGDSWTADGWFRTGDLGAFEDGCLRIVGRLKDVIKHGGALVWPTEIEELLDTHPAVRESAVIGVPDEYFGENACACVVPMPGRELDLDGVVDYLRGKIADYKLPQRVEILDELPRTASGKVGKETLKEMTSGG
jgi:acyl-CoA synthetase (AMP-forming)/AMP-acid ligase II